MNGIERYDAAPGGSGVNPHAWVSLLSGAAAMSSGILLVLCFWNPSGVSTVEIERFWAGFAFLSVFLGSVAIAMGAFGWNAVKRGDTSRGRAGAIAGMSLGALGALAVVLMIGYMVWLFIDFANSWNGFEGVD